MNLITSIQCPITKAEFRYQQRSASHQRRWMRWLVRAIIICTYFFVSILFASEIAMAVAIRMDFDRSTVISLYLLLDALGAFYLIPLIIILLIHFSLMLRTLSLSSNSIARERQSNNWDMLVLTGIDAGIIVRGKWWATVQSMWRPYLRLALLRALIIGWFGANLNRGYALSMSYYLYGGSGSNMVIPTIAHFVLAAVFVFTLTMANLLFTAACGVSAFNIRSGQASARAVATRLSIGVIIGVVNRIFFTSTTDTVFPNIVSMVLATLFDNGVFLGTETVTYHTNKFSYTDTSMFWLPVLLISLLVYALLTFLLLRFAQWQAVRLNALPPLPSTRQNPARIT